MSDHTFIMCIDCCGRGCVTCWGWGRGSVSKPTPPPTATIPVGTARLSEILHENNRMRGQIAGLQADNTRLVEELRAVDRRRMVREFHTIVDQAIGDRPHVPTDDVVRFRLRLIAEEFTELLDASLAPSKVEPWRLARLHEDIRTIVDSCPVKVDLPDFVDATVDLDYVVEGTRVTFGVGSTDVWAEVQRANMSKAGGPKRESDGKVGKPPGWQPPDIAGVLRRQGWDG